LKVVIPMLKCPNCSHNNEVQKYCGECGTLLIADGVTIKKSHSKVTRLIIGVIAFLLVWIIGGVILSFIVIAAGLSEEYVGVISFVLGIIVMLAIVFNNRNNEDN